MASVIRQAWRHARTGHHCYLCGHPIRQHDEYQDVTFRAGCHDRWSGLRFAKVCRHCCGYTMNPHSDCDYVVKAEAAEKIPDWLAEPSLEAPHG
ncbi:hypothetical protein [Azospirillum picis]|uniref:HNH endonuclease n=1 Tax=Azospirillum picis TaxID=488438 RepID=A0ABU0MQF7_9PROT|nr:hypothetical protein [Azospirillum picis]MBP2301519.1 hypothetical protein [Azospirillum picis]MDQ0535351.1 hypothetical protein [Azospirillum picis]